MKIIAIDIVHMRNMPVPKKNGKALPTPEYGLSTVIQIELQDAQGRTATGIGEIRATTSAGGDSPARALRVARRLAASLLEADLAVGDDDTDYARISHETVAAGMRRLHGIAARTAIPADMSPAVWFGFDCALLDAMARLEGVDIVTLLGGTPAPVLRNVFSANLDKPGELLNRLLRGKRRSGFLRASFSRGGEDAPFVLSAVAAAMSAHSADDFGTWFKLNGQWSPGDSAALCDALLGNRVLRSSGIKAVLEQPHPIYATQHYRDTFDHRARMGDEAKRLRIVLAEGVTDAASIPALAEYMPHVDLKITPQLSRSFHEIRTLLAAAGEAGFDGRIYLGNIRGSTELNTLAMVALAQVTGASYFSAIPHKSSPISMIAPQARAEEQEGGVVLDLPEDALGLGARLCRSGLEKRMKSCHLFRRGKAAPQGEAARAELIEAAFNDRGQGAAGSADTMAAAEQQ